jgi:5'-3' exonuclease
MSQLIRKTIWIVDPMTKKVKDRSFAIEKFGVPPKLVPYVQAIAGDKGDNIPGVEGFGYKTAAKLLLKAGDFDAAIKSHPKVKEQEAQVRISYKLAKLHNVPELPALKTLLWDQANRPTYDEVSNFLLSYGFKRATGRAMRLKLQGTVPDLRAQGVEVEPEKVYADPSKYAAKSSWSK